MESKKISKKNKNLFIWEWIIDLLDSEGKRYDGPGTVYQLRSGLIMNKFSHEKMNELIAKSGMTNKQIAHKLGIAANTISRWCTGNFAPRNLSALAKVLRCSEQDFFDTGTKPQFDTDMDITVAYVFNRYGVIRLLVDGELYWQTKNENYLAETKTAERSFVLQGRIGRYLLEAMTMGFGAMQDDLVFRKKPT